MQYFKVYCSIDLCIKGRSHHGTRGRQFPPDFGAFLQNFGAAP